MRKCHKKQKTKFQIKRNKKTAKEVSSMQTAVSLRKSEEVFINGMKSYIEFLKKQQQESKTLAKKEAKVALIRTGVLTEEGKEKEKIVTWE